MRIVRPKGLNGRLPVIVYMHGGGWILGNAGTHDRLVRDLAVGARAAVAFVENTPSPEARYPTAIEQGYATARWITREGEAHGLDASRMAVAGESVGGNITAALALMAKQRGDVTFVQQPLYYPVTDAAMDTDSYDQFAVGYDLSRAAMEWFWDAYTPDPRSAARSPRRRIRPASSKSPACRQRWSSWTKPTSCATRARPTPPNNAGRRAGHDRALRRNRRRLHAPELPQPDPRRPRRHRPGRCVPPRRPRYRTA